MVNITNRCTLRCKHCFVFRDGNPNDPKDEMDTPMMLEKLAKLQQRHGIQAMLWMGGEPLLRPDVLREGIGLFVQNTITTNGTLPPIELPNCTYVISVDGPPELNDSIRGKGSFEKVMNTLSSLPEQFSPTVMCQCVVTRQNEDSLEELICLLRKTWAKGMTFSFYVPPKNDDSPLTWGSLDRRDKAVQEVMKLKEILLRVNVFLSVNEYKAVIFWKWDFFRDFNVVFDCVNNCISCDYNRATIQVHGCCFCGSV